MNIILQSLTLHNFGSFKGTHTISLLNGEGTCAIGGVNEQDQKLGSNGAGKSTLWEGLRYLLYSKDSRGKAATNLLNWHSAQESMWVEARFRLDGEEVLLKRSSDKTSVLDWTVVSTGITQTLDNESVEQKIGMSADLFDQVVLHSQRGQHFLDMKPAEKLKLISVLVNAQNWDLYSKRAFLNQKAANEEIAVIKEKINYLEGQSQSLTQELSNARIQESSYREDIHQQITTLNAKIVVLEESYKKLLKPLDNSEEISAQEKKLPQWEEAITAASIEIESFKKTLSSYETEMASKQAEYASLERQKDRFRKLKEKNYTCPLCGNKADRDHLETEWKRLLSEQNECRKSNEATRTEWEEINDKAKDLLERKFKAEKKLGAIRSKITALKEATHQREIDQEKVKASISSLVEQRESLKAREDKNPWGERIVEIRTEVKKINENLQQLKKERDSRNKKATIFGWWINGFKEIKLYLVERIIAELQINVNNALAALGLKEYRIEFSLEKETSSGSLSQKFHTLVHSPHLDKPVVWEAWSGGEEQRLKLAASCGIVDAIEHLTGVKWNIEIWDEPTAHLSDAGVQDLLSLFEHRATTASKEIWTIDHRSLNDASFMRYLTVIKDEQGRSSLKSS